MTYKKNIAYLYTLKVPSCSENYQVSSYRLLAFEYSLLCSSVVRAGWR